MPKVLVEQAAVRWGKSLVLFLNQPPIKKLVWSISAPLKLAGYTLIQPTPPRVSAYRVCIQHIVVKLSIA